MNRTLIEIIAALLAAFALWYEYVPAQAPVGSIAPAVTAREVHGVPTVALAPTVPIQVYAPEAKKNLGLPAEVDADVTMHVLAADTVPCNDNHPQTIITLLDDNTGAVTNEVKSEPLPWLAAESSGAVGLYYGTRKDGVMVTRLSAREDVIEVREWHFGANGSLDSDGQYFVGAGVSYRF